MKDEHLARMLEVALGIFGAMLAGGLAVLVFGRISGDLARNRQHAKVAPGAGEIGAERHHHVGSSSPR